ncbi:MAG: LacI family DNA-binding transcriptional regulator [Burkholderiaceae bacterium]
MKSSNAASAKSERAARPGSGGVTLHNVAKLAGVSAITVSRALNQPGSLSPVTLARVRSAIADSGYVPNLMAGALASNRSRLVAALVPTIAGPVFMETIQALTETLAEAGCQLMLGQTGYVGDREDALLDAIIGRRPDGIVLTGVMHSAEGRRRLHACGIPIVETWDITASPIDMVVGFSHVQAGAAAADFLFAQGYRHPGLLIATDARALKRRRGFEARFAELGVSHIPVLTVPAPSLLANGRWSFAELRRLHPDIDVVFCGSDMIAHGVITEAQATGLSIPGDMAVMGFGDMPFAAHTYPPLTTIHIDGRAIGQQAARFILERADKRDVGPLVRDVGFSIVKRTSA